ncbi:Uncharacterised protein [Mycobacteroides abscessus subsp. abscessus]|nr:Uncharacterised protein [Mycobacteroides abscessus subsp. abscessus]
MLSRYAASADGQSSLWSWPSRRHSMNGRVSDGEMPAAASDRISPTICRSLSV